MKLSTSRIVLLCASLLLLLDSAPAQERQTPKPVKQQSQTAQLVSPQPTPQPPNLEGSYTLRDQTGATKIVNEAIESAVKGMGIFRGRARDKLRQANLPPVTTDHHLIHPNGCNHHHGGGNDSNAC